MDFIIDPSLALYLPLHELDGGSFVSKDAYGHACARTGVVWRPHGHYFDGTDDRIIIPNHPALNIPDAITVEAWINVTAYAGDNRRIVSKHSGGDYPMSLLVVSNGAVQFEITSGANQPYSRSAAPVSLNTWYHLCGLYDGFNTRLFVNLVEALAYDQASGTIDQTSQDINIGRRVTTNDDYYNGLIGEVRIYRRALNFLEIQHNYLATNWRYQ